MAALNKKHVLWAGLASALVMVIGAFGPWARVLSLVSVGGTDDGGDGWIVIGAAAVGALALFLWQTRSRRWLILCVIAGGAALATAIYDRVDIERTTSSGIDVGAFVDPGWGIYVAMLGSAGLAASAVAGWLVTPDTAGTPVPPPTTA
jgi:hypothetical protein